MIGDLLGGRADIAVSSLTINQVSFDFFHLKKKCRNENGWSTSRSPSWPRESRSWSKSRTSKSSASSVSCSHWARKSGCTSSSHISGYLWSSSSSPDSLPTNGESRKLLVEVSPYPMTSVSTIVSGSPWPPSCNRELTFCPGNIVRSKGNNPFEDQFPGVSPPLPGGSSPWSLSRVTLPTWRLSSPWKRCRLRLKVSMTWLNRQKSSMEFREVDRLPRSSRYESSFL